MMRWHKIVMAVAVFFYLLTALNMWIQAKVDRLAFDGSLLLKVLPCEKAARIGSLVASYGCEDPQYADASMCIQYGIVCEPYQGIYMRKMYTNDDTVLGREGLYFASAPGGRIILGVYGNDTVLIGGLYEALYIEPLPRNLIVRDTVEGKGKDILFTLRVLNTNALRHPPKWSRFWTWGPITELF